MGLKKLERNHVIEDFDRCVVKGTIMELRAEKKSVMDCRRLLSKQISMVKTPTHQLCFDRVTTYC
jgi:hypothetical protein